MPRLLAIALLLLACCLPAFGEVTSGGYVLKNGFYWNAGVPYTRQFFCAGTYSGVYYPSGYFEYSRAAIVEIPVQVPTVAPPIQPTPPVQQAQPALPAPNDPNWKTKILEVAAARDEHLAYLQAVKLLGIEQPGQQQPGMFGQQPGYSGSVSNLQLSTAGVNANTVYGSPLSYNALGQFYGDLNMSQLYQQAARLTENAGRLHADAGKQFSELVAQEGGNRAAVAKILAQAELLKASQGSEQKLTFQKTEFAPAPPMPNADGQVPQLGQVSWQSHATAKCASCHANGQKEGGFTLENFPRMSADQKALVLKRLDPSADPKRRMPRSPDGGPGQPLTPQELALWRQ